MDALERVLYALKQGKSLEEALSELPPHEAERIRPEAEAAAWLYRQEAALDEATAAWRPQWKRIQPQLRPHKAPAPHSQRQRAWSWPRLQRAWHFAVAAVLMVFVLLGGTWTAVSAQQALPGDWRYPIKRLIENTQYYLTPDKASRVALEVTFAQRRLEESEILLKQGKTDLITQTLNAYHRHMQIALQLAQQTSLPPKETQRLSSQINAQAQTLAQLQKQLPPQVRPAVKAGEEIVSKAARAFRHHGAPNHARPSPPSASATTTITPDPTMAATATVTATAAETPISTATSTPTVIDEGYQWQWQGGQGHGNGP